MASDFWFPASVEPFPLTRVGDLEKEWIREGSSQQRCGRSIVADLTTCLLRPSVARSTFPYSR